MSARMFAESKGRAIAFGGASPPLRPLRGHLAGASHGSRPSFGPPMSMGERKPKRFKAATSAIGISSSPTNVGERWLGEAETEWGNAICDCPASPCGKGPRVGVFLKRKALPAIDADSTSAGFSLVAVLVFMLIVSAIVVPFAVTARTRLMIANNELEQERLSLLAEGLGNVVASELTGDQVTEKLPLDSTPAACRSGKYSFGLRVQDHGGLIDLNAADDRLLGLGFAALGFEQQMADELARAAIRFRDSAKLFAGLPQARSPVGPPEDKQAPFESVSELQEFSALAQIPLRNLQGIFTVNSKRGTVSSDRAPRRLRAVLVGGPDASVVAGASDVSAYTVDIVVRQDGSGITGEAGFIIEKSHSSSPFSRVSRSPAGSPAALPPSTATAGCEMLFGPEAAQLLARWTA
ncbi:hypothetical protein [Mesorhizobium sp. M0619]|uniref:hypothetical protein n=2 Tax=unclassified Mesorhizobium TaxID=325217 RepID=UPI00333D1B27